MHAAFRHPLPWQQNLLYLMILSMATVCPQLLVHTHTCVPYQLWSCTHCAQISFCNVPFQDTTTCQNLSQNVCNNDKNQYIIDRFWRSSLKKKTKLQKIIICCFLAHYAGLSSLGGYTGEEEGSSECVLYWPWVCVWGSPLSLPLSFLLQLIVLFLFLCHWLRA